jgi:predicted porin
MLPAFFFDLAVESAPAPNVAPAEQASPLAEQAPPPADSKSTPPPWLAELAHRVDVYGRLQAHLAFSGDDVDLANAGSRFGFSIEQAITRDVAAFGLGEWSMNLGKGDTTYKGSENPNSGLGTVETTTEQAFGTRYGYIGMRFGPYGTLTLGKQDGVYYDISGWTDVYAAFGGRGSSTYNAGTDGGETGEGRANDAVTYRVRLGRLRIGLQTQFLDRRELVTDSASGSLVVEPIHGLLVGAAYSRAFLSFKNEVVGYDGKDAQAATAGFQFERGGWTLAVVDTWTQDHELVNAEAATVMYDTLGAEMFAARRFRGGFMPYAGFDFAIPRNLDARYVDPDYGTRDVIAGLAWYFERKSWSFLYLEGRTGTSRNELGEREPDVVTLGMRLDFSMRRAMGLDP